MIIMAVEFINFIQNGVVFSEEEKLLKSLFKNLKKSKKRFLVVRETWIDQNSFEAEIKNKKFDEVVTLSFMDHPNINYNFLSSYPIHKIGYYKDSQYYYDFHSHMVLKYLNYENLNIQPEMIKIPFMSLNGKPHLHREKLVKEIIKRQLHLKNIVSYNSVGSRFKLIADKFDYSTITPSPFDVYSLGNLENWRAHFLNVVTETTFNNEKFFFVTEKTYKPILGLKPFIIFGQNGNINILDKFKFENYYTDFIDITDLDLTDYNNQIKFLETLSNKSENYLQQKYKSLKEKILYNRQNFFVHQKQQQRNLKNSIKNIFS